MKIFFLFLLILCFFYPNFSNANYEHRPLKKVIIFDFHGVIGSFNSNKVLDFVSNSFQMNKQHLYDLFKKESKTIDTTVNSEDFLWLDIAKNNNIILPNNWMIQLENVMFNSIELNFKVINIIEKLSSKYNLVLFSNARPLLSKIIYKQDILKYFSSIIFSYQIKAKKPDIKAFDILLKGLEKSSAECIFIDDEIININIAKKMGFKTIHFKSDDQLISELNKLNIDSPSIYYKDVLL